MLLWLEIDGVLCKRGGNDLLWCCKGECNTEEGDCDDDVSADALLVLGVWLIGVGVVVAIAITDVVVVASTAIAPCEWFAQSCLKGTNVLH